MKNTDYKKDLKRHFPLPGIIIITILGISGFITLSFLFSSNLDLKTILVNEGGPVAFSIFFIAINIYIWVLYFLNMYIPPKEDVMYLTRSNNRKAFINKNGKVYECLNQIENEENKYYRVYRTHNYVIEVISETSEEFILSKNESYWLNLYLPSGEKIENLLLLPIAYVFLFPGLFVIILADELFEKVLGGIFFLVPLSMIVYDFYAKYKEKNEDSNLEKILNSKKLGIIKNVVGIIFILIILFTLIKSSPSQIGLFIIPIFVYFVLLMLSYILELLNNEKLDALLNKITSICFIALFLVEFTIFAHVFSQVDSDINNYYILIPIYVIGVILMLVEIFKKNKKKDD